MNPTNTKARVVMWLMRVNTFPLAAISVVVSLYLMATGSDWSYVFVGIVAVERVFIFARAVVVEAALKATARALTEKFKAQYGKDLG